MVLHRRASVILPKKNIVGIICVLTILLSVLGIFDTHAARVASRNSETEAKLDKKASEAQIESLHDQIAGLRQDGTTNAENILRFVFTIEHKIQRPSIERAESGFDGISRLRPKQSFRPRRRSSNQNRRRFLSQLSLGKVPMVIHRPLSG